MHSKRKPRVSRNPCVAVTAKQFDKLSGERISIEFSTLRVGEAMVIRTGSGQVVQLQVFTIPAEGAAPTQLRLEVSDDSSSLPDARGTHGTLE